MVGRGRRPARACAELRERAAWRSALPERAERIEPFPVSRAASLAAPTHRTAHSFSKPLGGEGGWPLGRLVTSALSIERVEAQMLRAFGFGRRNRSPWIRGLDEASVGHLRQRGICDRVVFVGATRRVGDGRNPSGPPDSGRGARRRRIFKSRKRPPLIFFTAVSGSRRT